MKGFVKTSSGHGHNRGCVPCALSALTGRNYDDINAYLITRRFRKSNNRGTDLSSIPKSPFGLDRFMECDGLTVRQFCDKNTTGHFLIRVNGHALTIKDGIIYDTKDSFRCSVKQAWIRKQERLPDDFDYIVDAEKRNIAYNEERKVREAKKISLEKSKKESYKKLKVKLGEIRKTPQYQLEQLLKRKKQWVSKLKKAQTYLKKVERSIKRVEKKIH